MLPTITLALTAGVRQLARRGAVVKRLSAVETLGSVTVICSDKTGTLTQNRMRDTRLWMLGEEIEVTDAGSDRRAQLLAASAAACTTAEPASQAQPVGSGDPTELALLTLAGERGAPLCPQARMRRRRAVFHFDPHLQRMTTIDSETIAEQGPSVLAVQTKGAPESVLPCCATAMDFDGSERGLDEAARAMVQQVLDGSASQGLRVLAVARSTSADAV